MNYKVLLISIVISLAAGALLERTYDKSTTPKAQVITQTVLNDHIVTVTKTVVQKDGSVVTDSTRTADVAETKNGTATLSQPLPKYMLGAGYGLVGGGYSAEVAYRAVGPVWVGVQATTNKELFVNLKVQF